jgi:hypothetical protein
MDISLPHQARRAAAPAQRYDVPAGQPWPPLLCLTAALLASAGLWIGLITLVRQVVAG